MVRQFDGFGGQFIGQMARILYLDAIVVDGDAYRTACIVKATMAQSISQCLAQSLGRDFELLISHKA